MLPIDCADEVNEIITSFLTNDLDVHCKLHTRTIFKVGKLYPRELKLIYFSGC